MTGEVGCRRRTDAVMSHGFNLHVEVFEAACSAATVVFIPGMGCHSGIYEPFLLALASRGCNVVTVDLPGHGRSSGARGVFTFEQVMSAVQDVVTYAMQRLDAPLHLLGTSLGGTFALYAALRDPRVAGVVCHGAMDIATDLQVATRWPRVAQWALRHFGFVARLAPGLPIPLKWIVDWRDVVDSPQLLRRLERDPLMVWRYALGSWGSFLDYPRQDLSRADRPVTILVGRRDRLFTPQHCRELAARIGRDGASLVLLDGGHALPLELTEPTVDAIAEALRLPLSAGGEPARRPAALASKDNA